MCALKLNFWSKVMPRNLISFLYLMSSPLSHNLGELLFSLFVKKFFDYTSFCTLKVFLITFKVIFKLLKVFLNTFYVFDIWWNFGEYGEILVNLVKFWGNLVNFWWIWRNFVKFWLIWQFFWNFHEFCEILVNCVKFWQIWWNWVGLGWVGLGLVRLG